MARLALTILMVVLTADHGLGFDIQKSFAEFIISSTARIRTNAILIRPKVMSITPDPLQPKVQGLFEWLLRAETVSLPNSRQSPPTAKGSIAILSPARPRMSVDEVETMLAKDLDAVMTDFKLEHPLHNIDGVSKTVKGDHGMSKVFGTVQRTNGKTVFTPLDETTLNAEVGFEFNLNVTYQYHLRAAMDRDGHTTTLLRHQQASFIAKLERPYSSTECYIRNPWINYPKVAGLVAVEVQAPPKFSLIGYHGGSISSTLFPQCHTDIETGIRLIVPPLTTENMIKYFREKLGGKVC